MGVLRKAALINATEVGCCQRIELEYCAKAGNKVLDANQVLCNSLRVLGAIVQLGQDDARNADLRGVPIESPNELGCM